MTCTTSTELKDIDLGTSVRVKATLVSEGVPVDGTVVLTVKKPDKTSSTRTLAHPATGEYYADVVVDQPGQWFYRFACTTPNAAEEGGFVVRRSNFT